MILTVLVVFLGGSIWTIFYSFTSSKLLPKWKFVGFDQYERLWETRRWIISIENLALYGAKGSDPNRYWLSLLGSWIRGPRPDWPYRRRLFPATLVLASIARATVESVLRNRGNSCVIPFQWQICNNFSRQTGILQDFANNSLTMDRIAFPRWLRSFFAAADISANVTVSPSGEKTGS